MTLLILRAHVVLTDWTLLVRAREKNSTCSGTNKKGNGKSDHEAVAVADFIYKGHCFVLKIR